MKNKVSQIRNDHLKALWVMEGGGGKKKQAQNRQEASYSGEWRSLVRHPQQRWWKLAFEVEKRSLERNPVKYSSK